MSLGFLAIPATKRCGNLCFLFPSSWTLVTIAFFPANLPEVKITTLPVLKLNQKKIYILPMAVNIKLF